MLDWKTSNPHLEVFGRDTAAKLTAYIRLLDRHFQKHTTAVNTLQLCCLYTLNNAATLHIAFVTTHLDRTTQIY